MVRRATAAGTAALATAVLLAACAGPRAAEPSGSPSVRASGACLLASPADLAGVAGGTPGAGQADDGPFGDGGCTWRTGDVRVVLAVTDSPDADLLAAAYPQPVTAAAVPGADRGWASADRHRIVVVKGDRGALLTVTGAVRADQAAYDALAARILRSL